jgi:hypothetical protein
LIELVVPAFAALLKALLPSLPTASASIVTATVEAVAAYTPIVIAEYKALKPILSNAIETLKANPHTTAEQLVNLRAMNAQVDADFDEALAKARTEDER